MVDKLRKVKSFVRREGRCTSAHKLLWDNLWPQYGLSISDMDKVSDFIKDKTQILEIGFGDGGNLVAQASKHTDKNFIGIDVYKTGALKVMRQAQELGLSNVKVCCDDAVEFVEQCIPDACLNEVLVFFPDPWQKKRHHKRRLLQIKFLQLVWQKLKDNNSSIHIATDWDNYAEEIKGNLDSLGDCYACTTVIDRSPYRIVTKFEQRAINEGRSIHEFCYKKL